MATTKKTSAGAAASSRGKGGGGRKTPPPVLTAQVVSMPVTATDFGTLRTTQGKGLFIDLSQLNDVQALALQVFVATLQPAQYCAIAGTLG